MRQYKSARIIFAEGRCPYCGEEPPHFRMTDHGVYRCACCAVQFRAPNAWFACTLSRRYIVSRALGTHGQETKSCYESLATGEVIVFDTRDGPWSAIHPSNGKTFFDLAYDSESELMAAYRGREVLVRHTEAEWKKIQDDDHAADVAANPEFYKAVDYTSALVEVVHKAMYGV